MPGPPASSRRQRSRHRRRARQGLRTAAAGPRARQEAGGLPGLRRELSPRRSCCGTCTTARRTSTARSRELDVKQAQRRAGAEPRRPPDQEPLLRRQRHRLRDAAMPRRVSARSICRRKSPATSRDRSKACGRRRRSCTTARCPRCTRCCCRRSNATRNSSSAGANTIPCTWATSPSRMPMARTTASGSTPAFTGNHNTGHAFAADAATWKKHLADPQGQSAAARRDRTGVHRRATIRHHRVPQDPSRPARDAGRLSAAGVPLHGAALSAHHARL